MTSMKEKNNKYEQSKKKLSDILKEMDNLVLFHKDMIAKHELMGDYPPTYDSVKGKQFLRLMEVLNSLKAHERNLFLCYVSNDYKYEKTLEVFNGEGVNGFGQKYTSKKSLIVLIYMIRKKIREELRKTNEY